MAAASCSTRRSRRGTRRCHLVQSTLPLQVLVMVLLLLGANDGGFLGADGFTTDGRLLRHRRSAESVALASSSSESPIVASEANLLNSESPTILTIDNLLSEEDVHSAMKYIKTECVNTTTTSDYQEDIFRAGAEEEEDSHFVAAVDRALSKGIDLSPPLVRGDIPMTHTDSPLEQFLWVITNHAEAMDQADIVTGANFIQRRQARQKWESEGGRQLLELSMDDEPFAKAGKRYKMPNEVKDMLIQKIVRRMMPNTIRWSIQDATVVMYDEGESQVPHVDSCDATILIYLDDGRATLEDIRDLTRLEGGETCFPFVGCRVPVKVGTALLFFSSTPPPSGERDVASLHHGGLVKSGKKAVAQIMLDLSYEGQTNDFARSSSNASWLDTLSLSST